MLIKESTLRRIIREEARRSLHEVVADTGRLSTYSPLIRFAKSFAELAPLGGASKLPSAIDNLVEKGGASTYAPTASATKGNITSVPSSINSTQVYTSGTRAQAVGQLAALLADLVIKAGYTTNISLGVKDWNAATQVLIGKVTTQDTLSGPLLQALGGEANAGKMIKQLRDIAAATATSDAATAADTEHRTAQLGAGGTIDPSLRAVIDGREVLKPGSRNVAAVIAIQQMINTIQGVDTLVPDGVYGNKTVNAVAAYQKGQKLTNPEIQVDGQVGRQTLNAMWGIASKMTGAAPAGSARTGSTGVIGQAPTSESFRRHRNR